jgi:hypothetical protein
VIQGNTITNLVGGGWVHAIGLDANTPGVLVTSNTINPLVSPSSDAVAVWFEVNNSYATAKVNQNNFNVTIAAAYGIAVQPTIPGTGDFIAQDGSGVGEFQAVLLGTSPLGTPQNITVEGEVSSGSAAADGSATFSGTASVDMGVGTPALLGVPFTVTVSAGSLGLTLNAVALPTATVSAGSITVK